MGAVNREDPRNVREDNIVQMMLGSLHLAGESAKGWDRYYIV